ncbi:MAG: S1C family serine protease [Gammaproteobacteria bacterium]|nr:S1C family serine protease [Gammaproteobacteria bacterium]
MNKSLAQTVIEISLRERLRLALLVTLLGVLSAAGADDGESVEELLTAVVGVYATVPEQARTAAALGTERFGSGVVIDSSGLIVTIGYLILEAEKVEIVLPNEELVPVEVLAYDYETGFGLLRAPDRVKTPPMPLGSSSGLPPGEKLLIASYGGEQTVRPAVFTGAREFAGYWEYLLEDAMFTIPPYPRFGGAALISSSGRLVGIGSLSVADAYYGDDMIVPGNMFLPIDRLKSILGDLLTEGRSSGPQRPWLGIYTEEVEGVLMVSRVAADGPAMAAGINPGDIIVAAGGVPVESMADFYRKVWAQGGPGDTISLTVVKGGEVQEVKIRSADRYQWLRAPSSN